MKNFTKTSAFLLTITILFLTSCGKKQEIDTQRIEKGVIDLTDLNFETSGVITLQGESEFYYNQLFTPEDFSEELKDSLHYVTIPGLWNSGDIEGNELASHGYGTYRFIIKTKYNEALIFKLQGASTAYKIWINGELKGEVGKVGKSKEEMQPMYKPLTVEVSPDNLPDGKTVREIEVLIQVSNFYHVNSGLWQAVEVSSFEGYKHNQTSKYLFNTIFLGVLLIMSIYHFALFFLRRDEYSTLFFGILTAMMVLRAVSVNDRLIVDLIPNINFFVLIRFEYLSAYANIIFIAYFFYHLFKEDFSKIFLKIFSVVVLLMTAFIIFAPVNIFTYFRDLYNLIFLIGGVYVVFFALTKAVYRKRQGAILAFVGVFVFFITGILDVIITIATIPIPYTAHYGLVFYILTQSFTLSQRFSVAFKQNKELNQTLDYQNKNLEGIVKERTAEISQQAEEILAQQEELIVINEELQKINGELEKLSIVASETDNAVLILDKNANFEWANEGFKKLFGYDLKEITKQKGENFIQASNNPDVKNSIQECINTKKTVIYQSQNQTKDKGKIWTQTTLTPILDEFDNISKIIAIDSDISKLKDAEEKIAAQNQHIRASINYAKTIQRAILPPKEVFGGFETFVLYKPKDVVSGDFYWTSFIQNAENDTFDNSIRFLAVVDCTGHGVPGAFMSMIGNSLLNQIVNVRQIYQPKDILTLMHERVQISLRQKETDNNDGMDVALVKLEMKDEKSAKITFAGAKRPLFYFKNNIDEIQTIKGCRKSIGGVKNYRNEVVFNDKELFLEKNEQFYLLSDGIIDQNNHERKRFGTKHLQRILSENRNKTMKEQKNEIETALNIWQADEEQRDDITIVGVKI